MEQIFWILLVFVFGIAAFMIIETITMFIICREQTTGVLIGRDVRMENDMRVWRKIYSPVYEYEVDGKIYQATAKQYSKYEEMFTVGDKGKVRYNPNNPKMCIVNGHTGTGFIGIVFFVFGIFLLIIK